MRILESPDILQKEALEWRKRGLEVGFVPTMGALHKGHMALINQCRKENEIAVVSIFVNPKQFCEGEDYSRYPRDLKRDQELCASAGVDVLFCPHEADMYPEPYLSWVEVRTLQDYLCGKYRKGHFVGVTTVVLKLFNLVLPTKAYFGQKDYQQAVIIKKMVADLNIPVSIITLPTVRDEDGLACSSRNLYLSSEERKAAAATIPYALNLAERLIKSGEKNSKKIIEEMYKIFASSNKLSVEYISICAPDTLVPLDVIEDKVLVALAVWVKNKARLIDNALIEK